MKNKEDINNMQKSQEKKKHCKKHVLQMLTYNLRNPAAFTLQ